MKKKSSGEIQLTKDYLSILKDVHNEKGLLPAIGYEVMSTINSLGQRLGNLFDVMPPKYEQWSMWEDKQKDRKQERIGYLLRGKKNKVTASIAGVGIILGTLMSATNITGNVISNVSQNTTSNIGLVLLAIGTIALVTYKIQN